ncbi:MAG: hypothetical protein ACLQMS_14410 [Desulfomonilaceae bacterium]
MNKQPALKSHAQLSQSIGPLLITRDIRPSIQFRVIPYCKDAIEKPTNVCPRFTDSQSRIMLIKKKGFGGRERALFHPANTLSSSTSITMAWA